MKDIIQTRPSKAAAFGMLSRAFLQMRDYRTAGIYADSCLQINGALLDYNKVNTALNFPFPALNAEVCYEGMLSIGNLLPPSQAFVIPELYNLYSANDLRKTLFFRPISGNYQFKGSYEGSGNYFCGISTNEELLTRSECRIRAGETEKGLDDLNLLLRNRYRTGTFTAYTGLNQQEALALLKTERRKELVFRGLRWADIRRYNQEGDNIVLKRTVNGKDYILSPNSLLLHWLFPRILLLLPGSIRTDVKKIGVRRSVHQF